MDSAYTLILLVLGIGIALGTPWCIYMYYSELQKKDHSIELEEKKKRAMKKGWIGVAIGIALILPFMLVASNGGFSGSRSIDTNTCRYCGKTYKAGDSNGNYLNIAKSNLCNSCYAFNKSANKALGK